MKSTLDTKYIQRTVDIEAKIKEVFNLLVASNGGALPVVRDLKVLFFGLNNVWQPWMSEKHKPQQLADFDSEGGVDPKFEEIVSQEMTLSSPNE